MRIPEALIAWGDAWHVADAAERLALLQMAVTDDVRYTNEHGRDLHGRSAVADHIDHVRGRSTAVHVIFTSGAAAQHEFLRYAWQVVDAAGAVIVAGEDVCVLAPDGRLSRIAEFPATLPAASAWPERLRR